MTVVVRQVAKSGEEVVAEKHGNKERREDGGAARCGGDASLDHFLCFCFAPFARGCLNFADPTVPWLPSLVPCLLSYVAVMLSPLLTCSGTLCCHLPCCWPDAFLPTLVRPVRLALPEHHLSPCFPGFQPSHFGLVSSPCNTALGHCQCTTLLLPINLHPAFDVFGNHSTL